MDTRQKIHKALLLLDKGQNEQAVELLKLLLQELDTTDHSSAVRCAVILGDHFSQSDKKEAIHWCTFALKLATEYPELEDTVGYELQRAATLLDEL